MVRFTPGDGETKQKKIHNSIFLFYCVLGQRALLTGAMCLPAENLSFLLTWRRNRS